MALRDFTYERVCRGRLMKSPPRGQKVTDYTPPVEPKVFIAFAPMRPDSAKLAWEEMDPSNTAPSITIMPSASYGKYMEIKRFDQYNGVHRPKEMGQQLALQLLFSVFEDGVRMPGFIQKIEAGEGMDMSLVREGTQEGLFTVLDWMDDFIRAVLGQKMIPGSDLMLDEASLVYGLRADQKYVTDSRPMYYGVVDVAFNCYADEANNPDISRLLN